jgi:hypothetical protein
VPHDAPANSRYVDPRLRDYADNAGVLCLQ